MPSPQGSGRRLQTPRSRPDLTAGRIARSGFWLSVRAVYPVLLVSDRPRSATTDRGDLLWARIENFPEPLRGRCRFTLPRGSRAGGPAIASRVGRGSSLLSGRSRKYQHVLDVRLRA